MTREEFIRYAEGVQRALRRFLTALCCGDTHLADDLAQETLVKAYLSSDSIVNSHKFNSWIFTIAHNTFINSRRCRRPTVDLEEASAEASAESADGAFRYQALYVALNRLAAHERTAILLYYLENYSVNEIADIVGVSVDAVRQQLSRGRKHLRSLLENTD